MQHRPSPDDRGIVLGEKSDRHHLHAVLLRRNDLLAVGRQLRADSQHLRNVRTVDVAVQEADAAAALCERHRQIDGHGRFSDAALSGAHGDDVLDARQRGTSRFRSRRRPHFRCELNVHLADPGNGTDHGRCLFTKLFLDGTRRRGQFDRECHAATRNRQILDETEGDDVAANIGVDNGPQRVQDCVAVGLG